MGHLKISYVGVHVRLTDYPMYLERRYGLKEGELADTDYYVRAMEYMLKRLREDGILKVVFAVVSDDMNWATNNLIPQLENYLKSKKLLGTNAVVSWCGSEYFMNDLVLLSSCNHSIIAYGTFGSWSALMAGGWTVVF
ncbi:L-Fucosyltransferase, partial [Gryllus bimaculatus]